MSTRDLYLEGKNMAPIVKALSSDVRLKILDLLDGKDMNIQTLCAKLNLSKAAVINHINLLEQAGFITTRYVPGSVGNQKLCSKAYDRLIFNFSPQHENTERCQYYELEIAPGNYFDFSVYPPCGLADEGHIILKWDDPSVFFSTERVSAQLAWAAYGYLEYRVPLNIPFEDLGLDKLSVIMELGAQGDLLYPGKDGTLQPREFLQLPENVSKEHIHPHLSDVTLWLGNAEVATVTVVDDSRLQRAGRYTPMWWRGSAFGQLVEITLDKNGTYLNGQYAGPLTLSEVLDNKLLTQNRSLKNRLASCDYLPLRIGMKPTAKNMGGFTLFGKGFGNYPHGILVRFY